MLSLWSCVRLCPLGRPWNQCLEFSSRGAGALRLWARDAWLSSESDRRPVGRRAASVLNQQPRFGPLWARADMFTFSFISSAMRCHLTLPKFFWDRIQPETFWLGGRKPWPATLFSNPGEFISFCTRVCKCKRRSYNVTSRVCASAREDLTT